MRITQGAKTSCFRRVYTVLLVYFWLESVELAKNRVIERVKKGGHTILPATIERRYFRGIKNFFLLYQDVVDSWVIYDNSNASPKIISRGIKKQATKIYISDIWSIIQSQI